MKGRPARMRVASRSITSNEAPTWGARVGFVDDQKVGFGDRRAAFARDFFACGHINHIECQIRQFRAEGGR